MNILSALRKNRTTVAAASIALLALTLTACGDAWGSDDAGTPPDGITLVKPGKLTVCTQMPFKPFQFKDGDKVVGFDVDLLDLLAKDLKVEQDVVNIEWAQITSGAAFKAKKCDVGMGAMTITDERQKAIGISTPYMDATQVLLVKADSGIKTLADLRGKKLGVQADTTGKKYAEDNAKANGYTVITFTDLTLQTNNVKSGRVDAAISDNAALYTFAKENPDTAVTDEFDTGEQYGFATDKTDPSSVKLLARLDALLKTAKTDGTYNEIFKKWFGVEPKK